MVTLSLGYELRAADYDMDTIDEKYYSPELLDKISRLELRARMVVEGALAGLHKSPYRGFNVEFLEHREYYPGDDIRHVDWKLYARRDRFYVRQYEEETSLRAYVLLDSSASMRYGGGNGNGVKLDYAALLAASLSYLFIKQGDAAGLATFDSTVLRSVAPRMGRAHLYRILAALAGNTAGARTDVAAALAALGGQIKPRSFVILISDLLVEPQPVIAALKTLSRRQSETVIFNVMHPDEIEFPFTRASRFLDPETGLALPADPDVVRARYKKALAQHLETFRSFAKQHSISFIHASTAEPADRVLLGYLQQRELWKHAHR